MKAYLSSFRTIGLTLLAGIDHQKVSHIGIWELLNVSLEGNEGLEEGPPFSLLHIIVLKPVFQASPAVALAHHWTGPCSSVQIDFSVGLSAEVFRLEPHLIALFLSEVMINKGDGWGFVESHSFLVSADANDGRDGCHLVAIYLFYWFWSSIYLSIDLYSMY